MVWMTLSPGAYVQPKRVTRGVASELSAAWRATLSARAPRLPRFIGVRTWPDPKYRSIPSSVLGGTTRRCIVLNCKPCVRSVTHQPTLSIYSPGEMVGAVPTTVTRSRCPRTLTRSTQKPVSSLWNVTRSTLPARCSRGVSWVDDGVNGGMAVSLHGGGLDVWQRRPTHLDEECRRS